MSDNDTRQQETPLDESAQGSSNIDKSTLTKRDLGTVGGGNIPGGATENKVIHEELNKNDNTGQSDAHKEENKDSNNKDKDGARAGDTGEKQESVRSVKNSSNETSPAAINTIDKQAQSGNGGRHPSQPQTPMGDQDANRSRSGEEIEDPMSSRAPDKINQKQK